MCGVVHLVFSIHELLQSDISAVGAPVDIHHSSCVGTPSQFDTDRPSAHPSQPCSTYAGYRMPSVYQAFWKYLHGKSCTESGNCSNLDSKPTVDSLLEAIFYAFSLGNLQSYKQFFGHMATYLGANHGDATESFFRETLTLHGLLD